MRRFRFVGESSNYLHWSRKPFNGLSYRLDELESMSGFDNNDFIINGVDFRELFDEPNPLHKDTDLGYFTIEIIKSIIKIAPLQKPNPEATNELFCKDCISLAKELIKQLNEETK